VQVLLAVLNCADNGNRAAFMAGAAAKMTRAVRSSQVRARNNDFGHLCLGLQAMLLVSVTF